MTIAEVVRRAGGGGGGILPASWQQTPLSQGECRALARAAAIHGNQELLLLAGRLAELKDA
jgi:hypothetical protein